MDRKHFLKLAGGGILAASFAPGMLFAGGRNLSAEKAQHKLTILHTNDQHSRIDPFDAGYTRNPNQGGFARRAKLINDIRGKERNVLLLDSGDVFQGTPYFNLFGGELELKLMSMMGYDATTVGNHEFDNGLEGLLKVMPNANFPYIISNYNFDNTILSGKTLPYKVFEKGGIRVGIFGLGIKLAGLVGKRHYGETQYLDPVEMAQHYSEFLKKEKKCNLVICLSHLGYKYGNDQISDLTLAPRTENIDLILGGHTHTFLPEPQQVMNRAGKPVLINQVGWAGLLLGRLDYYFDKEKNVQRIAWGALPVDGSIIV